MSSALTKSGHLVEHRHRRPAADPEELFEDGFLAAAPAQSCTDQPNARAVDLVVSDVPGSRWRRCASIR